MAGISRYEKMALCATAAFAAVCLLLLVGLGRGTGYTVTAAPAGEVPAQMEEDGFPDSLLPGEKININTAPAQELQRLPGIGEKRAADIVSHREQTGGFTSIEELTQISGIGPGTLGTIADYITISEE